MKIDNRLQELYKHASKSHCGDIDCCNYISCGPIPGCNMPCKCCLFWTGYGLKNDIDGKCLDWINNKIKEVNKWHRKSTTGKTIALRF